MFYGANVENAAYPMGICAERSSLVSAISEGYQPGDFESITVTVDADKTIIPMWRMSPGDDGTL